MNVSGPSRQLARPAAALCASTRTPFTLPIRSLSSTPSLHASAPGDPFNASQAEKHNPVLHKYLEKRKEEARTLKSLPQATLDYERGTLGSSNIFHQDLSTLSRNRVDEQKGLSYVTDLSKKYLEPLLPMLDPEPAKRIAWQRRKVVQDIKKRGYLTKEEQIKRTEREYTGHSEWWYTSTKKLTMLARQVHGKTLEEAYAQMRFSKKRYALPIRGALQEAERAATVERGMGLGEVEDRTGEPIQIRSKDGKKINVTDRTNMYVDQAWVVRGPYTLTRTYRARGRVQVLRHPMARIHFILKEEATRVRLHEEREEKRKNRKLWVHLPDRPVTAQRQYALW